ncbi:MAG: hypothetical protein AAF196_13800 [Planctomycetota bacterium]
MTTLQFSLFFAALILAYGLVHLRLIRFEKAMDRLRLLEQLDRRVQRVGDQVERTRLDRVEELLHTLVEEAQKSRVALEEFEVKAQEAPEPAPRLVTEPVTIPQGREPTSGERLRAAVDARLLALGFRDLRLLDDIEDMTLAEFGELKVECLKGEMPHKGTVSIRNGAIVDVDLRSVARSFP